MQAVNQRIGRYEGIYLLQYHFLYLTPSWGNSTLANISIQTNTSEKFRKIINDIKFNGQRHVPKKIC